MQNDENSDKRSESDDGQNNSRKRLIITRDLIGPLSLLVLIVGAIAAYYAYFYVSRDSVRIQFWVGFMFSFLALVVIIVQVVIYAQQAEFMKRQAEALDAQLDETRKATRYGQAAYITVQSAEIVVFEIGEQVKAKIVFVNSGNTPAYRVRVHSHFGLRDIPFSFTKDEIQEHMTQLGPKDTSAATLGANGDTFSQEPTTEGILTEERKGEEKTRPIHLYGLVTYRDIFKRSRWTQYCYERIPGTMRFHISAQCNQTDDQE